MTAMVLLTGAAMAVLLVGCGSEGSVDDASGSASATTGGAPAQSRPALPPPVQEPDNEAVNAALLGMSQAQAEAAATEAGYTVRIASVDGEGRAMTMDYRFDRINIELEGGLVTRAYVG
ncbi:MAG: hypothetical protein QG597_1042 [Actinomycetota bacterium]|nr:hypothetical protein [Actinomycetota bacterium]